MRFSKNDLVTLSLVVLREEGPMPARILCAKLVEYEQTREININSRSLVRLIKRRGAPQRLIKCGREPSGAYVWGVEQSSSHR